MARVLAYNLRKPYKMVVSQTGTLIIQNGMVYQMGSGAVLGKVVDMLKTSNPDVIYCKFSGATFPNTVHGKEQMQEYQERKGYINRESDGTRADKPSTLEERQAEVKSKRDKINKKKGEE